MNNIKVSILVPICNVEKFLNKCLQSLVDQTLQEIEIICINDGSTDGSLSIVQKFAMNDERILIINKNNSGYGDSMNRGLKQANGEYIGVVESDDFADREMFADLYRLAKRYEADVVKSNFIKYWESPEKKEFYDNLGISEEVSDLEFCRTVFLRSIPAIWSSIYKRSWLEHENICFLPTPGAAYQDTSFKFKVACLARAIALTPNAYLNYRQDNAGSSVKANGKDKILLLHKEYDEIKRFLIERNLECFKSFYCEQKLGGMLWNYNRSTNDFKKCYFDIICNEIEKERDFWEIDIDRLPRILRCGGYKAILKHRKLELDILLGLKALKDKIV